MRQVAATEDRAGFFSAWGLLAGLAGSLCCIGPSAAVLLGLGSSSALFGLTVDRTLALIAGGALLLIGLALALRRVRACELRLSHRWRQPAILLATFAVSYSLLGLLAPQLAARQEDAAAAPVAPAPASAPQLRRVTLIVEKMVCPPCAAHMRSLLKRKPFVRGWTAESGDERVTIDYDSRQASAKTLIDLIPQRFGVTVVSDVALP
jgi:hypothetical protein